MGKQSSLYPDHAKGKESTHTFLSKRLSSTHTQSQSRKASP
jgi:hypothetical protein